MPLEGSAFLALLNDFDPERDAEYNRWHCGEHVPERLTVPGFTAARRYVNRRDPVYPYFTIYEVASAATFLSRPYLHLMSNPTPWSARMRTGFRNFYRLPCSTLASVGDGVGGALGLIVLVGQPPAAGFDWAALCRELAKLDGVVGAHAGQQDASLPGPPVASARAASTEAVFVLMLEAQELELADAHARDVEDMLARSLPTLKIEASHGYRLMHVLTEGRVPTSTPTA